MFEGVSVALVTPFSDGALDEDGLRRVAAHVLDQGVQGLVPTGSTGEAPTLDDAERERIWSAALEAARGRAFVLAGTGTNDTRSTIERTRRAAARGVDGCMLVCPYYNKPGQEALEAHFLAVADAVDVPLVLYNVPGRTGVNLLPATVTRLARHPHIVAIKEASGSLDQATEILNGSDITLLSGDDSLTLPTLAVGGKGIVSVLGHLAGREMVEMVRLFREGRVEEAAALHRRLFPVVGTLFLESNPAPVKAALAARGIIRNELRQPLRPASAATAARVAEALRAAGLDAGT